MCRSGSETFDEIDALIEFADELRTFPDDEQDAKGRAVACAFSHAADLAVLLHLARRLVG